MNRRFSRVLGWVVVFGFAVCTVSLAQSQKPGPPPTTYRSDTILVKPKRGLAVAQLATQHAALRGNVEHTFPAIGNLQIVKLPPGLTVKEALHRYRGSGLVEYAEPDYEVYIVTTPDDPQFVDGTLWGLNQISMPQAWDMRTSAYPPVVVAVIDTGVRYDHEDLAANLWVNPCLSCPVNGVVYTNDVYGINAINNTGNPWDDHYHGTHVSGTIGAVGNNGTGVVGVAWNVRIMALKFLNSGGIGYTSDAIKCINYAIAKHADILNNSWGGGGADNALRDAIIAARDAGIIFVAAAGNNNSDNDATPFYPAGYDVDNIVAVAATDSSDALASFSNYGANTVELAAPGVNIYSTYTNATGNAYTYLSGTSMAAPHVSGALALIKAQFPGDNYAGLISRMLGNVDELSNLNGITLSGGRLNVYKALTLVPKPIASLAISPSGGTPPLAVTFTDNSLGDITARTLDYGDGSPLTSNTSTTHTYDAAGNYTATLSVSGPTGSSSRTRQIVAVNNYAAAADTFNWINTSGMTALSMIDDSVSPALPLPFAFAFYGQTNTSVYVGSNGLLVFGNNAGGAEYNNTDLPTTAAPNNAIYPYWDDLNPTFAGQVRYGTAPDGSFVVSWEGVPHFSDSSATFTFQVVLFPSGAIKIQYLDVKPTNLTVGAGRNATIGLEHSTGLVAAKYSYNGSTLLANSQAIRFTTSSGPPPPGALSVGPADGLSASGVVGGPFNPSSKTYTLTNTGGQPINWSAWYSPGQNWCWLSPTSGTLAAGASATVSEYISTNANSLPTGNYSSTVSFANVSNGNGNTNRSVSLTVTACLNPPANLKATLSGYNSRRVVLNWTDTSTCETGFKVERQTRNPDYTWTSFSVIATPAANATSYKDRTVALGERYRYRVLASNGTTDSGYSNPAALVVR